MIKNLSSSKVEVQITAIRGVGTAVRFVNTWLILVQNAELKQRKLQLRLKIILVITQPQVEFKDKIKRFCIKVLLDTVHSLAVSSVFYDYKLILR